MQKMKVLETRYRGILFRSRLEARWAVFMDHMGVVYTYEPEGYDLDGVLYLPDFWLPRLDKFLEIKPKALEDLEKSKATRLAQFTSKPVLVLKGYPARPMSFANWYEGESSAELYNEDGFCDEHYIWCQCPSCLKCDLQFDGRADRISCVKKQTRR